ncbi:putative serine protease K12H4.7 isoform X2 [Epargyreus clarus]
MIGGEGPADARWMIKGAWLEYAESVNALCIMLEHRYYGKSYPLPDMSVKNLEYLSSRQALADLANFIGSMNQKYDFPADVKWIVFGGSYPGSMAAWMRLKYPHMVYAAVSSSGPLKAKMDFQEYYKVVVQAVHDKTGNNQCIDTMKLAHNDIAVWINVQPDAIEKSFKLCKQLKNATALDIKTFYNTIADDLAEVVQYNEDNRISVEEKYRNITINTVCDMLTVPNFPPSSKLASFTNLMLERSKQECLDYSYDNMIEQLQSTTWTLDGGRQWFYQTCTEFGFYQTSSGETEIFGNEFDLEYFVKQCQDVFGPKFDKTFIEANVKDTNIYYGGTDIAATRVLYVQGSVDPWHALGLTATKDPESPVIYINGTAHCANMYPSTSHDLPALQAARVAIRDQLNKWLETA